jgi:proteasome lid subunit RPN8/RPN11
MINRIKEQIKSIALSKFPDESCGLVIENGNELTCFSCGNIAENKKQHFVIDPKDYVRASRLGKIVAMFHSQENDFNEGASQLDILNSKAHDILSIIYCWRSGGFFEIDPKNTESKALFNLDFEIGKNDCFSLVRNHFKTKHDIEINDYKRNDSWFDLNPGIIENNYKKEEFQKVNMRDLKEDDVILFGFNSMEASHMGIYLGNELFLHHPRNKRPAIEFLSKSWSTRIKTVLRHKKFIENYGQD